MKHGKDVGEDYKKAIEARKEAVNKLRKKYRIKVEGDDIPEPLDSFFKLQKKCQLSEGFMQKLKDNKFLKPTPV